MAFTILYDEKFLDHRAPEYHPESPERLEAIKAKLEEGGRWAKAVIQSGREATENELCMCHHRDYVQMALKKMERAPGYFDADTFFSGGSKEAALKAAGGVIEVGKNVMDGKTDWCLGLVRPPGHHATKTRAMGFCIFNNVALCAKALIEEERLERVLIFDWDVHHGNGTQDIFYDSKNVLYSSIHQYPFYPGTGSFDEIGDGDGKGYTFNVPYPPGAGDNEYIAVLKELVIPVMEDFKPEIIIVSAGFDAHHEDLLGGMRVTTQGYGSMARLLLDCAKKHCNGRVMFILEGGYTLDAIASSAQEVVDAMEGKEVDIAPPPPSKNFRRYLDKTKLAVEKYWKGIL